jgi:hypothetical protein
MLSRRNQFEKRKPNTKELRAARLLAKQAGGLLLDLMEAGQIKDAAVKLQQKA